MAKWNTKRHEANYAVLKNARQAIATNSADLSTIRALHADIDLLFQVLLELGGTIGQANWKRSVAAALKQTQKDQQRQREDAKGSHV